MILRYIHGAASRQRISLVFKRLEGYKIIKAFRIKDEDDLKPLANYKPNAFLLDSYVKGVTGGTGVPFKWEIARQAHEYGTIILSGGLTPENVKASIQMVKALCGRCIFRSRSVAWQERQVVGETVYYKCKGRTIVSAKKEF